MRRVVIFIAAMLGVVLAADVYSALNTARIAYFNEKDYPRARKACLEGIDLAPDNCELYAILAGSEMGLGNWPSAAQAFDKAFTIDTSKTLNWIFKEPEGAKYYFQAFYFSARELFERVQYDSTLYYLGYAQVLEIEDVNVDILKGAALYKLERFNEANSEYMRVLELDPNNPDVNFLIGKSLFDSEEYEGCLGYFTKAIQNYKPQYERFGRIIFQNRLSIDSALAQEIVVLWAGKDTGRLDQLIKDSLGFAEGLAIQAASIEQFAKASDNLGRSHYFLAMAQCNLKNDTVALNNMLQSVKYRPDDYDALYFAGEWHVRMQKYAAAIPHLERLTNLCPDDQYAWFYLAVCYTEAEQYKRAADIYENKVLKLDPDNIDAMNNLAYVYREMGEHEKALHWFIRAEEAKKGP